MNEVVAVASLIGVPLGTVALMLLRARYFPQARPPRRGDPAPALRPAAKSFRFRRSAPVR